MLPVLGWVLRVGACTAALPHLQTGQGLAAAWQQATGGPTAAWQRPPGPPAGSSSPRHAWWPPCAPRPHSQHQTALPQPPPACLPAPTPLALGLTRHPLRPTLPAGGAQQPPPLLLLAIDLSAVV
ncbi:hypothetical protein V8C86DRAFT_2994943 [Haematococcus lacustris]